MGKAAAEGVYEMGKARQKEEQETKAKLVAAAEEAAGREESHRLDQERARKEYAEQMLALEELREVEQRELLGTIESLRTELNGRNNELQQRASELGASQMQLHSARALGRGLCTWDYAHGIMHMGLCTCILGVC
jgi:hypothetical protein